MHIRSALLLFSLLLLAQAPSAYAHLCQDLHSQPKSQDVSQVDGRLFYQGILVTGEDRNPVEFVYQNLGISRQIDWMLARQDFRGLSMGEGFSEFAATLRMQGFEFWGLDPIYRTDESELPEAGRQFIRRYRNFLIPLDARELAQNFNRPSGFLSSAAPLDFNSSLAESFDLVTSHFLLNNIEEASLLRLIIENSILLLKPTGRAIHFGVTSSFKVNQISQILDELSKRVPLRYRFEEVQTVFPRMNPPKSILFYRLTAERL